MPTAERLKLLLLSQEFPPETSWGGIGTYAGIIGPALVRAGVDVHVLSVVSGQPRSEATVDGVRITRRPLIRPPGIGRLSRLPLTWDRLSLARAIRSEIRHLDGPWDVVETPEWHAEGLALALRPKVPLVVRSHSAAGQLFPYLGKVGPDQRLAAACENALLRRAAVVTGPAAQVQAIADNLNLDPQRVRPIPYPVRPVERCPLPHGPPRVLFLGRFERRKNPQVIVRAARDVLRAVPETRFRFRGRDTGTETGASYVAELRRLAEREGIAESIEIVSDWAAPDEVQRELSEATVFVFPSQWESFGMAAAEAAAIGRPVVASDIPPVHEIVEDGVTGRLVDPDDASAWSTSLIELLSDRPKAAAMGEAGAQRVTERCHPDRVAQLTVEAYRFAMGNWRRGR